MKNLLLITSVTLALFSLVFTSCTPKVDVPPGDVFRDVMTFKLSENGAAAVDVKIFENTLGVYNGSLAPEPQNGDPRPMLLAGTTMEADYNISIAFADVGTNVKGKYVVARSAGGNKVVWTTTRQESGLIASSMLGEGGEVEITGVTFEGNRAFVSGTFSLTGTNVDSEPFTITNGIIDRMPLLTQ